jgi:prepilin-type N-terminal cleavage/methylation domain-containing protein
MKTKTKTKMNKSGFTLIELLIVIGLLGALVALILPRLTADREEAMGDVCDYNQAGTVRVLTQYVDMFGAYPAGMHNGMQTASGSPEAMEGLPEAQEDHMVTQIATTRLTLDANQAKSLVDAGIKSIAYGTGYNIVDVAQDVVVAQACAADGSNPWFDDSDPAVEMTFDGIAISDWAQATAGATPIWNEQGGAGPVVCLWITPTIDWAKGDGGNTDWTKGAVEYGISMEGKCPIPTVATSQGGADVEVDFAYYMAYFKVYNDGTPARMIGSTCPECGVLNP